MIRTKDIQLEDLSDNHREIAEAIGIENLLKLCEVFGGTQLYVPKRDELLKNARYRAIYKEFDGGNIKSLSRKYGVSESTVYKIVRDRIGKVSPQLEGQISIFDLQQL